MMEADLMAQVAALAESGNLATGVVGYLIYHLMKKVEKFQATNIGAFHLVDKELVKHDSRIKVLEKECNT